ncbi:hypothetical protein EON65_33560 [archaeon]|nr:MAG: hypothetical protein EON65_33560 [archaeon]
MHDFLLDCHNGYGLSYPFQYSFSEDEGEDRVVGSKRKKDENENVNINTAIVTPHSRKKFTTPVKK